MMPKESIDQSMFDLPIEELDLSLRSFNCLKRAGLSTIRDLSQCSEWDIIRIKNLGKKSAEEVFFKIKSIGIKLRKTCSGCNSALSTTDIINQKNLCNVCIERANRILMAKEITLDISPPEVSLNQPGNMSIYINIKNNTNRPIKLALSECAIFKEGRQHASNFTIAGYHFFEEYIFPNSIKTIAKVWKTTNWVDKKLIADDLITILIKNVDSKKHYYFKYAFLHNKWNFYDYYEA